ncbi:MAG: SRPBCC domain-containing protein [Nakamurella sp.]
MTTTENAEKATATTNVTPAQAPPTTVQINRIYIKATPQAIWDAITKPEWTEKYGYGGRVEFDLRPGGKYRSIASEEMQRAGMPEVVVDGEVIATDPPNRLVQTWRAAWTDEPATRLTYEISGKSGHVSCLTVTHELDGAPNTAAMVAGAVDGAGGGWAEVISDLKTLLETGSALHSTELGQGG